MAPLACSASIISYLEIQKDEDMKKSESRKPESIQVIWAAGIISWFSMETTEQDLKSKDRKQELRQGS